MQSSTKMIAWQQGTDNPPPPIQQKTGHSLIMIEFYDKETTRTQVAQIKWTVLEHLHKRTYKQ